MKKLAPYLILFVISLGLAYKASLPVDSKTVDSVRWLDISSAKVKKVEYFSEKTKVEISPVQTGYWADLVQKVRSKKDSPIESHHHHQGKNHKKDKKGKVDSSKEKDKKDDKPEYKEETYGFKLNERFTDFLNSFSPLLVKRVIGKVEGERLESFGLGGDEKEVKRLVIKIDGKKESAFQIGKRSYGSSNLYVKDESSDQVLLVASKPFDDMSRAKVSMFERKIYDTNIDDVEKAVVSKGGKEAHWSHTKRDGKGRLTWMDESVGGEPNSAYGTFIEKISKLRIHQYANKEEASALEKAPPLFGIKFLKKGSDVESLVFKKLPKGAFAEKDKASYWVRTNHLGHFAKVSSNRLESLDKSLPNLLNSKE